MEPIAGRRAQLAVLLGPGALWLAVFFVVPLGFMLAFSFAEPAGTAGFVLTGTLENYARVGARVAECGTEFGPTGLACHPVLSILLRTLWISALATGACLLIGLPVAILIAFAPGRLQAALLFVIVLPFWTNLLIRTYALRSLVEDRGILQQGLSWLGLLAEREPLGLIGTTEAVVIGLVFVNLPYMVLPIYAALDRLDRSLIEASLDLGAGQVRTFARIVVPLALPGILTGLLLVFIPTVGTFIIPQLLGGLQDRSSSLLGNEIEAAFRHDLPFGSALALLMLYAVFGAMAARALFRPRDAGPSAGKG